MRLTVTVQQHVSGTFRVKRCSSILFIKVITHPNVIVFLLFWPIPCKWRDIERKSGFMVRPFNEAGS